MSRIEQIISDMEAYLDNCKCIPFTRTMYCDKDQLADYLNELRMKTPEEVKKYQRILANKDAILADAKEQADSIINAAQIQTEELINEHEIMQRAYAQANELIDQATAAAQKTIDDATSEANSIRVGAMEYTDEMLGRLQYIIEHSIKDNQDKYASLMSGLQNILTVVNNNRNELHADEEGDDDSDSAEEAQAPEDAEPETDDTADDSEEAKEIPVEEDNTDL